MIGLFVSSLFLAGIVGALVASLTSRKFGRRNTMLAGGLAFLFGSIIMASAVHMAMLIIGRLFMGLGVGLTTQAAPLFLSEMAPYKLRGALNVLFQLSITIGILVAQLINYGTQYIPEWGWRLSLGLCGAPAILLVIGCSFLPDTPNSLLERGFPDEAKRVLRRVRGVEDVSAEYEDIREAADAALRSGNQWRTILKPAYRPQLILCILIPALQQLTGINSVIFYAPQLFSSLGAGSEAALLNTVIIGAVNVLSTLVALYLVDRLGRKALFYEGGLQMIAAEVTIGVLLATQFTSTVLADGSVGGTMPPSAAIAIIVLICVFIAGFAWSWGPLCWLVCTEIQPLETRSAGYAISVTANFALTFLIGQAFLSMLCAFQWGIFVFFAGWVLIMTIVVLLFVPETKGVPMEEIQEQLFMRHWFWGRLVKDYWGEGGVRRWSVDEHTDAEASLAKKGGAKAGGGKGGKGAALALEAASS
jgi:sugar porter (SP) family MFS transporter